MQVCVARLDLHLGRRRHAGVALILPLADPEVPGGRLGAGHPRDELRLAQRLLAPGAGDDVPGRLPLFEEVHGDQCEECGRPPTAGLRTIWVRRAVPGRGRSPRYGRPRTPSLGGCPAGGDTSCGRRPAARIDPRSGCARWCAARRRRPPPRIERLRRSHSARNVSCTTSSATPRRRQPAGDREDRGTMPIVEVRQGVVGPGRDLANEGSIVLRSNGISIIATSDEPRRFPHGSTRRSGRRSKPLESTTSVSVVKTFGVLWSRTSTSSRCRVSCARILRR